MMYLLDVNALVALGFQQHEFHRLVALWVRAEQPGNGIENRQKHGKTGPEIG